jgi:hypothetical protein
VRLVPATSWRPADRRAHEARDGAACRGAASGAITDSTRQATCHAAGTILAELRRRHRLPITRTYVRLRFHRLRELHDGLLARNVSLEIARATDTLEAAMDRLGLVELICGASLLSMSEDV